MESKTREVGGDANLPSLNFCVVSLVFPTFSFKIVYHEYLCAFSVMLVVLQSQEHIYGWPAYPLPRLDQKVLSQLSSMMTSLEGPLFSPASGPPTLSLPLTVTGGFGRKFKLLSG